MEHTTCLDMELVCVTLCQNVAIAFPNVLVMVGFIHMQELLLDTAFLVSFVTSTGDIFFCLLYFRGLLLLLGYRPTTSNTDLRRRRSIA